MKNVKEKQIKKCIRIEAEEFTDMVHELLGNKVHVDYTTEGLDVYTDAACIEIDTLSELLSEYFDVKKVTSVHTDHCDYVGVWIVYED